MTDTTRTLIPQLPVEPSFAVVPKPIVHETLHVPGSAIDIKQQVRNGELDGFEIEHIVVDAHTTDDTKRALLAREEKTAQPFTPIILTDVKCKTAAELSMPSYQAKPAVNKYKSLLLPKRTAKKRAAAKAQNVRRGRARNKKSLLPPTRTLRKDPRAKK